MKPRPPRRLQETASTVDIIDAFNELLDWALDMDPTPEPTPYRVESVVNALAHHKTKTYGQRPRSAISQIVIHHVGVDADVSAFQTAAYHVRKGWPGIGYHYYIRKNGLIQLTNHLTTVSYHCGGDCNTISVGVCLEGSFMGNRIPTERQLGACLYLNYTLCKDYDLNPIAAIKGHREVRQTACPGSTWAQWKDAVIPGGPAPLLEE